MATAVTSGSLESVSSSRACRHVNCAVAYVYILRCSDGSLYIGSTADLDMRVARHNRGDGCAFTARRTPVTLLYSESHATRTQAMSRERRLKRWTRAKKEALIAGDLAALKKL